MLAETDHSALTLADLAAASANLTQEIVAALAPYTETERTIHRIAGALLEPNAVELDPARRCCDWRWPRDCIRPRTADAAPLRRADRLAYP
jgi:hypothetical protein